MANHKMTGNTFMCIELLGIAQGMHSLSLVLESMEERNFV
jgi:hypothetical protein